MKRLGMLLAVLVAGTTQAQPPESQQILDCMRANVPPALRVQGIELTTTDATGGTRVLSGRLYAMSETEDQRTVIRTMLRIEGPASYAGAAYLVRQSSDYLNDGMYVYLPSVRRVRRVTGTFADGALMGTDFSYEDFKQLQTAFSGTDATLEANGQVGDRMVRVMSFKTRQGAPGGSRYSLMRAWVDEHTCLPLKVDFYEGTTLRKQLTVLPEGLRQSDQYWYPSQLEMRDTAGGTQTVLKVREVEGTEELPARFFNPTLFYVGS